jgi:hypothetical protein
VGAVIGKIVAAIKTTVVVKLELKVAEVTTS